MNFGVSQPNSQIKTYGKKKKCYGVPRYANVRDPIIVKYRMLAAAGNKIF
jgi:hypothetical protein